MRRRLSDEGELNGIGAVGRLISGWGIRVTNFNLRFVASSAKKRCMSEVYDVRPKQLSLQVMPISQPEHVQW
jgi:hypothetical protein